jgi:hypothetical protein
MKLSLSFIRKEENRIKGALKNQVLIFFNSQAIF